MEPLSSSPSAANFVLSGRTKPTWEAVRALYYYYLNLLRKMEKQAASHHMVKDAYMQIRRDRLRYSVLQERFQFLNAKGLDAPEQIQAYAKQTQEKITPLLQRREQLYTRHRRAKTPEKIAAASKAIGEINAILKTYRKEERLCKGILREMPSLQRVIRKVHQPIQREEKVQKKTLHMTQQR